MSSDNEIDIFGPAPEKVEKENLATTKRKAKEAIFIVEYLKDRNATRSARVAGYSRDTAYSQGSRLLKKVEVREEIERLTQELLAHKKDGAKEVIDRLYAMAVANVVDCWERNSDGRFVIKDLDDIPEPLQMQIKSIKQVYDKDADEFLFHITMTPKEKALELLGKYHKLFVERFEHSGNIGFSDIASKIPDDILGDRKK